MKKIDWDRYVPLGIDGAEVRNNVICGLCMGALWSLGFLFRFADAKRDLYFATGKWTGLPIRPFGEVLGNAFLLLGILALVMAAVGVIFYCFHYQDSRSIYTMKRLPNRWELWRRCLAVPLCTIVLCAVLALLLTGIYYLIYLCCTPAGCLP